MENQISTNTVLKILLGFFFIVSVLMFLLIVFKPYEFEESHLIQDEITKKVNETKLEVSSLQSKINNYQQVVNKINDVASELDAISQTPEGMDFTKIISSKGKLTSVDESKLNIELYNKFTKPVINVLTKKGFSLQTSTSKTQSSEKTSDDLSGLIRAKFEQAFQSFKSNSENVDKLTGISIVTIDDDYIKNIEEFYSDNSFLNNRLNLANSLRDETTRQQAQQEVFNNQMKEKQKFLDDIDKEYADLKKNNRDRIILKFVLPMFGIILIIMMIVPRLYSSPEAEKLIFEKGLLLQLITIFLLTGTILILGIGGKLSSEVLGTLLGGISVYVLQRAIDKQQQSSPNNPQVSSTK